LDDWMIEVIAKGLMHELSVDSIGDLLQGASRLAAAVPNVDIGTNTNSPRVVVDPRRQQGALPLRTRHPQETSLGQPEIPLGEPDFHTVPMAPRPAPLSTRKAPSCLRGASRAPGCCQRFQTVASRMGF